LRLFQARKPKILTAAWAGRNPEVHAVGVRTRMKPGERAQGERFKMPRCFADAKLIRADILYFFPHFAMTLGLIH
jgi:hypothetical protein